MKSKFNKYIKRIKASGADKVKLIHPQKVVVGNWVRLKCQFGCDAYRTRYTCPPYSPTPAYTRQMLKEYKTAIFFTYTYLATRERKERQYIRRTIAKLEREMFLDGYYKAFALGAGPCNLCPNKCDFKKGCLHTELARPSMEACGIDVYKTAKNAGVTVKVVKDLNASPTYCCLMLVE
jgi:predicted metal-binding protein